MRVTDTLPRPSAAALAHSQTLARQIHEQIARAGGCIPFHDFMQMALYQPGLGYYVAGLQKFGQVGDFVTAPEISPLFAQCLANACAEVLHSLAGGSILELGAGSGKMAVDLLLALEKLGQLPEEYLILDVSPDLQEQQRQTLQARAGHLLERVRWLQALPTQPVRGVILGNEVLDAMPVEMFQVIDGEPIRVGVRTDDKGFALTAHPEPLPLQQQIQEWKNLPTGYTSEYNPALPAWMQSMADVLQCGVLLLIDYGYERKDYYHPERAEGTLICHYQHRVHDNPLLWPGLQDITASVDFTAVAEAGTDAGMALAGYTTQASFLINTGLENLFIEQLTDNPASQYQLARQIRLLTLPSEMGERFKVIAFSKGFTLQLSGFRLADQRHRL